MNPERLVKRLEKHPQLLDRFEAILNIAENSTGSIEEADHAEMMAIEETRKIGSEMLRVWASNQEIKKHEQALEKNSNLIRHAKKNSIG